MLGWSMSDFPIIAANKRAVEPYTSLWLSCKELDLKLNRWTRGKRVTRCCVGRVAALCASCAGPVFNLNSEDVSADVDRMFKALTKAGKALRDLAPAVAGIADSALARVRRCAFRLPVSVAHARTGAALLTVAAGGLQETLGPAARHV